MFFCLFFNQECYTSFSIEWLVKVAVIKLSASCVGCVCIFFYIFKFFRRGVTYLEIFYYLQTAKLAVLRNLIKKLANALNLNKIVFDLFIFYLFFFFSLIFTPSITSVRFSKLTSIPVCFSFRRRTQTGSGWTNRPPATDNVYFDRWSTQKLETACRPHVI